MEALLVAAPQVVAEAWEGWFGPQVETSRTVHANSRRPVDGFDLVQQGGGSCRCEGTTHQKMPRFSGTGERARAMASLGELSSARLTLEGEAIDRGDEATLAALRDRRRRPPEPREPIPEEVLHHQPAAQLAFDNDWFLLSVRSSKKRTATGPSGMTCDNLLPLLCNNGDSELLCELAQEVVEAEIPAEIVSAICLGRMTALKKPSGGVRGMEVGGPYSRAGFGPQFQGSHHTNTSLPQGRGASPPPSCFRD